MSNNGKKIHPIAKTSTKGFSKTSENNTSSEYSKYTMLVKELSKVMTEHGLYKIAIEESDLKVELKKYDDANTVKPQHFNGVTQMQTVYQPQNNQQATNIIPPATVEVAIDYSKLPGSLLSPMVGVIYTKQNPESNDFVKVGDSVKKGDTVLLIEAMKVFNPIKAHIDGKVTKILVKNNEAVEYDELLIVIE